MPINPEKTIILGIDGGSWDILNPLMQQGFMPNLKKVCQEGAIGILKSTQPPFTGPAWVSSVTGVNPGKHGVFGFTYKEGNNRQRKLINSTCVKVPKLWNYLTDEGKTCGIINVPVTYPPEKINGYMISGFLAPQHANEITYPEELYTQLLDKLGSYIINVRIDGRRMDDEGDINSFIDDLLYSTQKRFEALKIVRQKYPTDFLMIVFTCIDKIQHKFYKYLDCRQDLYHSDLAIKIRDRLLQVFQLIDRVVEYFVRDMDDHTTLYIISDHGFGPLEKRVYLNKWLAQQKLLVLNLSKAILTRLIFKLRLNKSSFSKFGLGVHTNDPLDWVINHEKSIFICSDAYEQGIYFNKSCSQIKNDLMHYQTAISSLKEKLLQLKDPDDGSSIVDAVKHRSEIYWGPYVDEAPDLLLRMNGYGYLLNKNIPIRNNMISQTVHSAQGSHRMDGIIAAYGKNIVKKTSLKVSIMDIAPTVLFNMGIPISTNMDGKVLRELFTTGFNSENDILFQKEEIFCAEDHTVIQGYSEKEEEEVRKRLSELGYFD